MGPIEKELEDRLKDVGMRLTSPPPSVDELLRLLDQTEIYLSRVEQSPSTSMSDALRPAMNSLISKEFLHHSEMDVKVFVAACINEITRITAPDAPYSDSLMKEIFAVIVDAFEKLDDISGRSYSKRVSILETVAKVRSCVVMLDLECDDLVLQMFKHFLKSIRPDHSINVFSSMETIMTLVLEDSEDISQELLDCLLSSVLKSKKDVIPVSCMLAEKVISNCATKLKPYLLAAVKSTDTCLSDYGDIIAAICQECSVSPKHNEVDDSKLFEKTVSDELPQKSEKLVKHSLEDFDTCTDKTRKVPINGVVPSENENPTVEPISAELKHDNSFSSEQCRNNIAPTGEINNLGSNTEKSGNELDLKHVEAKSSPVQLTDVSNSSQIGDKEASPPTIRRAGRKRKTKNMKSDGASNIVPVTEVLLEPNKEVELRPIEGHIGDSRHVVPAEAGDNISGSGLSKMGQAARSQFNVKRSTTHKTSLSAGKKKKSRNTTMEGVLDMVSEHEEDHCAVVNLDEKPSQDSAKKSFEDIATTVDVAVAAVSDGKSLRKEQNDTSKKVSEASSSRKQRKSSVKKPKNKDSSKGDVSAEQCFKDMTVSSKDSREANNDESHLGTLVETSSSKKRQRKTSGWKIYPGRKIEVWWPEDQMFYKGVIDQFDPVTERHKVLYDDGDVEFLLLRNERWNYIDSKNLDKGQENDNTSPESSVLVLKKSRESAGKSRATPGRDKSVGEFEAMQIQTSHGGKSAVKSRGRPRQETSKVATSPDKQTQETYGNDRTKVEQSHGGKSVVKSRGRSKQETSKVATSPNEKTQRTQGSDGTKIEKFHGEKSEVKSRGRPIQETPKAAISPDQKTLKTSDNVGTKFEESHKSRGRPRQETSKISYGSDLPKVEETPQTNNSIEPPEDDTSNKVESAGKPNGTNKLPSSVGKSVSRSRRRPKGENNQEIMTELSPTKFSADDTQDTYVVKDGILTEAEVDEKSKGKRVIRSRFRGRGRKLASKSRGKPKTSNISTQTDISDDPPTDTPGSGEGARARGKRKETAAITTTDGITDANISAISTSEGKQGDHSTIQSVEVAKARGRRKETAATTNDGIPDANTSAIKTWEGKEGDVSAIQSGVGAKARGKRKETSAITTTDGITDANVSALRTSEGKKGDDSTIQSSEGAKARGKRKESAATTTDGITDANASALKTSEGKEEDESVIHSSVGSKARGKRKETAATMTTYGTTDANVSAVKTPIVQSDVGRSQSSAVKPNKRRRK